MHIYCKDIELQVAGASDYRLGTGGYWYAKQLGGGYDTSHVDLPTIDAGVAQFGQDDLPLLMDIEAFSLQTDFTFAVRQLTTAAMRWKSALPDKLIGFYAMVPERNYWTPVRRDRYRNEWRQSEWLTNCEQMQAWQHRNELAAEALLPFVDFVCPSIYAFYADRDAEWRVYADANLAEAARVACEFCLPVWPILWPFYHSTKVPIPLAAWTMMVQFAATYPGVDALMLYTGGGPFDPRWREPLAAIAREVLV